MHILTNVLNQRREIAEIINVKWIPKVRWKTFSLITSIYSIAA